jgi:molybdopterin-binding protein
LNRVETVVEDIKRVDSLCLVKFAFSDYYLSMISLELNSSIEINSKVKLAIKPTSIIIAKNFSGDISLLNKLESKIKSFEEGEILSRVEVALSDDIVLESVMTTSSFKSLNLTIDDKVDIFIKASEIAIIDILGDRIE